MMRYLVATFVAILLVALLACNSKRMLAERKLLEIQADYQSIGETVGYQKGLADGINAAIATVRVSTNGGKPSIDLADTLEYARTNKSK